MTLLSPTQFSPPTPPLSPRPPAAVRVAAASLALRRLAAGTVAVAEGPNGPQFPNGYVPVRWDTTGQVAPLGRAVVAGRWWDPAVRVGPLDAAQAARFVAAVEPIALPQAPEASIGWGPGLTPAGDDVVVGMLVAHRAVGAGGEAAALAAACATSDTTPLSRALLDHASRGEAVRPLLDLLRALTGHGDIDRSLSRLTGFGATSGRHLIEGVRRVVAAGPAVARS